MTDYKDTLNLPSTDFPMKANLAQREPELLQRWQELNIYQQLRLQRKDKKKFILLDGPPYANGEIHIGHAVNKVLKDIVVKSKSLAGLDTPFIPGWDCHGLPIELNVEKKVGKPDEKISALEFRKKCREYATEQINLQREAFKRLGVFADWQNPYLTMDYQYEADIIRCLASIIENGHLQRGQRPVHWCIACGSALAEAEVEYKDKSSPAVDVRFVVVDNSQFAKQSKIKVDESIQIAFPIWTTTPWTLPANQAVAINAELIYQLIKTKKEILVLAKSLVTDCLQRYGIMEYEIAGECKGKAFEKLVLQHPYEARQVSIILGEHVTVDTGTGSVHTAPGHGPDDYLIGLHYHLPILNPVNANGYFFEDTPLVGGLSLAKSEPVIISALQEQHKLLHLTQVQHSYPHCWRHKLPLIFRATAQWFVNMDQEHLREMALEAITTVQWIPEWGEARITEMVAKRPDWCISRQRTWGTPMALLVHKRTGQLHPRISEWMEAVAKRVELEGIDAWYSIEVANILGEDAPDYEKSTDTLDVWFDSGVTHTAVAKQTAGLQFPADLYLEGSDQHRGWFQSNLLTSCAIYGEAPYRQVLTHGFTVDAQGRKMSKSLGNVIAPSKVIQNLGADVLRLWVASTDYRAEIAVSDEILKRAADVYRRLRNTARFLLANLHDFNPQENLVAASHMLALDKWIMDKARLIQQEIIQAYETYQFHSVYQKLHYFCSIDLGSFYLDVIKDRQYTLPANSIARRSAQTAMYHVLEAMVRWFAPIISFTAEEIWQYMPGERTESVFLTTWYDKLSALNESERMNQHFWQEMILIRDAVNKQIENLRNQGNLGSGLQAKVMLYADNKKKALLKMLNDELHFVFITSEAHVEDLMKAPDNAADTDIAGLKITIVPSAHNKCIRCWHWCEDVGKHSEHSEICGRCITNITSTEGEVRRYA